MLIAGQGQIVFLWAEQNHFNIQAEGQGSLGQAIMYDYKNKSCMSQGTQSGSLYQPRWGGRWQGGSRGRGHMYTYGWFMLMFDRKQQNSVKQLSYNLKINKFFKKEKKSKEKQRLKWKKQSDMESELTSLLQKGWLCRTGESHADTIRPHRGDTFK